MSKEESSPDTHTGRERFLLEEGASTGIRLSHDQKLVGQSSCQVAKTERRLAEVAAHLAVKEHLSQGEGQDSNHGERDQRLTMVLVHRRPFEMPVGRHGLKHFTIDQPTAT